MIKKIIAILFVSILFLSGVSQVIAGPDIGVGAGSKDNMAQDIATKSGYSPNVDQYTLSETIGRYIRGALSLVGTVFFVLTIYAGVLWMTAQGNGEQVEKATGILKTSIIGLIIVFGAFGITWFVLLLTTLSAAPPGSNTTNIIKSITNSVF